MGEQSLQGLQERAAITANESLMAKKKITTKPTKSFEQNLWDTADKLRGTVESSEYKHVVLSLIFLKFISDKFERRRAELAEAGQDDYVDMVEFYAIKNILPAGGGAVVVRAEECPAGRHRGEERYRGCTRWRRTTSRCGVRCRIIIFRA